MPCPAGLRPPRRAGTPVGMAVLQVSGCQSSVFRIDPATSMMVMMPLTYARQWSQHPAPLAVVASATMLMGWACSGVLLPAAGQQVVLGLEHGLHALFFGHLALSYHSKTVRDCLAALPGLTRAQSFLRLGRSGCSG